MPFGINVVTMIPFTYSVMANEWNASTAENSSSLEAAWEVGILACFLTGKSPFY